MEKPIVFLFSGQGSQYFQMGKELFDEHPLFRKWMLGLDDIVKNIVGESLLEQVYAKEKTKEQKFSRTLYTHPAIFMVEYALAQVLMESGITPNYVLGSSMGEFTAAAIADILSLEETLEMLINQAVLLETHCEKGEMLAIFHDPNLYHENPLLYENSELASVNFDSHFVVSGKSDQLSIITEVLKSKGILYETLPVSHAFHSSLIDPVEPYYQDLLKNKLYRLPKIPFISCLYSKILTKIPDNYLWDIIRKPTLFSKTIQELEQNQNSIYLDLGPSGTLNNFIKRNIDRNSNSESYPIMTMYYQDTKNLQRIEKLISNISLLSIRKEDKKMITYIFPGQGSQHKGMGGTLFDEFEELTIKADKILGYSIKELCLHDLNQQLGKTQFTQPALYVVNALSFLKRIKETGTTPEYVAGHSLGEYNALFAAGAFDFETGLKMVKKRGELMSQATEGGMAAVIGLTVEQVNHILIENGLTSIDIANHNSPSQIVIAGPKADIEHAQPFFEAADAKMYIPLNVSGAFHSRYMHEAKEIFEGYLEDLNFKEMKIPVISNVHARPYKQTDIKRNLVQQITHPVKWTDSIRYLMGLGKMEIEEIGPGRVLTKLMETIQKEAEPLVIDVDEEENNAEQQNQANTFPIITASSLGDEQFKKDYGLKYAYITGAMYKGVSSEKLVVKIGRAGMLGFYGTGGLSLEKIEEAIQYIQRECSNGEAYGMNLLHDPGNPLIEEKTVDLYLKHSVRIVEASGYISITPSLTRYRAKGLVQNNDGTVAITNKIIAKVSRPEVAEAFLSPAPDNIVEKLIQDNIITWEEANLLRKAPLADDICVEADSGGHTDRRTPYALMPAMLKLRDEMMKKYGYSRRVRIGAAGGIGTPEAAAAAFMLGADFIVTGSINQCTVEANTNDIVKDLLQQANIQDTDYAPSEEMFEIGAKVQVLKKGVFFPARANKLYDLYRHYDTLDAIDEKTTKMIQEKYFHRSFEEVYQEVKAYKSPEEIEKAERNPKYKMALIFKWYLGYSTHLAMSGNQEHRVDYQIQCGPALGAFNQWVKGTPLENWRNRHVDEIGERLMKETAELLNQRFLNLIGAINFIHSEEALQVMSL